jgi:hypothetical protein
MVTALKIEGDYIFAGTGSGVWKRALSDFNVLDVSTTSIGLNAANNTATFAITSNVDWLVSSSASWLTLSSASGSGNATITLTAGAVTVPRSASVTVSSEGMPEKVITVSQDGIGEWVSANNGLYGGYINAITVDPITNHMYAGTTSGGVFKSIDNGNSWIGINKGLYGNALFVMAIATNGSNVFIGTGDGVYISTDNGGSWTAVNNGFTGDRTNVMAIAVDGSNIFAGTDNGIIYQLIMVAVGLQ